MKVSERAGVMIMKLGVVLLALVAMTMSEENKTIYDGLRVKYGKSDSIGGGNLNDPFYKIPRNIARLDPNVWTIRERPPGSLMTGLRMFCNKYTVNICPLYDVYGFISGIQIAIPLEAVSKVPGDPTTKFLRWNNIDVAETTNDYWTTSLFFVSEETQNSSSAPSSSTGGTLQSDSVWAYDPTAPNKLVNIPLQETELSKTELFQKQSCVPNMGFQYYYNLTPQLTCDKLFPWSALVTNGQVVGATFQAIGLAAKSGGMYWFEEIPPAEIKLAVPASPTCLTEWINQYGLISLHIYFISTPWEITCP